VSVSFEDLPEFLTVEEAAEVLRIGRTAAYMLTRRWRDSDGREGLPVERLGRLLRVPRAALERMAQSPGNR
jgi:excisionase family DNA binding protein